jgi:hypothetical protein
MADRHIVPNEKVPSHPGSMARPVPYQGGAAEPRKASSDTLADFGLERGTDVSNLPQGTYETNLPPSALGETPEVVPQENRGGEVVTPTSEQPAPAMQSTPPPEAPSVATELTQLRKDYGEAIQNIGAIKQEHEQQIEEMRFAMEMSSGNGATQPQFQMPPVPEGVDLDAEMKVRDYFNAIPGIVNLAQAQATAQVIRATRDETTEQETAALQKWPVLAQKPEPARTLGIQRAVRMMSGPEASNPAPAPQSTAPAEMRPAAPVLPQPEASYPATTDIRPTSQEEAIRAKYVQAEQMEVHSEMDRKKRLRLMREAADELDKLRGVTDDTRKSSGFVAT